MTMLPTPFVRGLLVLAVTCLGAAASVARQPDPADVQLRAAMKMETVDGDLRAAIAKYQELADGPSRPVAAMALARLGQCYEKLGAAQTEEARGAYEQVLARFADQPDAVSMARARLAVLGGRATSTKPAGMTLRRLLDHVAGVPGGFAGSKPGLAAIGADGRFLVFTNDRSRELHAQDTVSGKDRIIDRAGGKPPSGGIYGFAVSPDGKKVAYRFVSRLTGSGRSSDELRVAPLDGGTPRTLVSGDRDVIGWLSDDLVYTVVPDGDETQVGRAVETVSASTGEVARLPQRFRNLLAMSSWPRLSPDGRFITFSIEIWPKGDSMEGPGVGTIFVREAATGREAKLPNAGAHDWDPVWTPDGGALLFLRERDAELGLWMVSLKNGAFDGAATLVKRLPGAERPYGMMRDGTYHTPVGVSRDGSYHYLQTESVRRSYVVSTDRAGRVSGDPTLVGAIPRGCGDDWSPDGRSITMATRIARLARADAPCSVLLVRSIAGNQERTIPHTLTGLREPRWSPDGNSLIVVGHKEDTYGVFRIDAATGATTLVAPSERFAVTTGAGPVADWHPDGKSILIARHIADPADSPDVRTRSELVYRDLKTGQESPLYSLAQARDATTYRTIFLNQTTVGPDGSACLLTAEGESRLVVLVPGTGAPPRILLKADPPDTFQVVAFGADGRGVWINQRQQTPDIPAGRRLLWVPADGSPPVESALVFPGMDVLRPSPDGSQLCFDVSGTVNELWTIGNIPLTAASLTTNQTAPRRR